MSGADYPLDHGAGYAVVPCDLANLRPFIRDAAACQVYLILLGRVRRQAGMAGNPGSEVPLDRGQALCGIRELAAITDRSKNTIARVLDRLERLGLIARKAGHLGSVITLCRYGAFDGSIAADGDRGGDTPGDTPGDRGVPLTKGKGKREREQCELPLAGRGREQHQNVTTHEGADHEAHQEGGRRRPARRTRPAPHPDHARLRARWEALYTGRYGSAPTWGPKQAGQLARLLGQLAGDELERRMVRLMTAPPTWLRDGGEHGAFDLGTLVANVDRLAAVNGHRHAADQRAIDDELERREAARRAREGTL